MRWLSTRSTKVAFSGHTSFARHGTSSRQATFAGCWLSGPRVHASNAYYYRKYELDQRTFSRSNRVIERALQGGRHLTRRELAAVLERNRIPARGVRLAALVMHAELEGIVCSGPRRGNQFSYALLEERVARAPRLKPNEGLAELTLRYFAGHGPATVRDFAWCRVIKSGSVSIEVLTYAELSKEKMRALNAAARRHAAFLKMPVTVTQSRVKT